MSARRIARTQSGSYTYQVAAKNIHGTRGWAPSSAVIVNTNYGVMPTPLPTYAVPAANATGSVTLSWSAATPVTQYLLQQSSNGGANWSVVYTGVARSAAVSGLADGSYTYRLQACNNTAGNSVCTAWVPAGPMVVTHPPTTAPTVSVPAGSTNGSYTVTWSGVPGPVSYTLQESANGAGWSTIQTGAATSKAISGKGNGSYAYRAQACNVGGCGPWSASKSTTVLLPPAAPASISIPASSNGPVGVNWAASTTATSYTLQHAHYQVTGWSTVYSGGATGFTQQETVTGTWIYQVQACNASGCSAFKVSAGGVAVTIPPTSAPSLSVPGTSSTGNYTVSWAAISGATSYTLQEQVNGGGWATIQNNGAVSKAISGKTNGSYGYRAQACNVGGCGAWSATKAITVALVPTAPTGVQVVQYTINSKREGYRAQWNGVSGATRYEARRTDTNATVYNSTATNFIVVEGWSPIDPDEVYDVQVRACNAVGCSGWAP